MRVGECVWESVCGKVCVRVCVCVCVYARAWAAFERDLRSSSRIFYRSQFPFCNWFCSFLNWNMTNLDLCSQRQTLSGKWKQGSIRLIRPTCNQFIWFCKTGSKYYHKCLHQRPFKHWSQALMGIRLGIPCPAGMGLDFRCWLEANVPCQGGGVVKVAVSGRGSLSRAVGTWCSIEVSMVV